MTEDQTNGDLQWQRPHGLVSLQRVLSATAIRSLAFEVIKRLNTRDTTDWSAPQDEVHKLCHLLCAKYPFAANRMIDDLLRAGVPIERINQNYLSEAARELGRRWDSNEVSFDEVGSATTRIYIILDTLRRRVPPEVHQKFPKIAFAGVPGDPHVLGVQMAVDRFRREGWDVDHLVGQTHDEIVQHVEDDQIALIGLSASGRRQRTALIRLVIAIRLVRPTIKIILSGGIVNSEPQLLAQVGIDAMVADVEKALVITQRLLTSGSDPDPL